MVRGWERGQREAGASVGTLGLDLRDLCSEPETKIPCRSPGPISILGDILRDLGLILAWKVSLHQGDP